MSVVDNLVVRLVGEGSSFTKMINVASTTLNQFNKQIGNVGAQISKIGAATTNLGKKMTMGITVPAILAGGASVKAFADFDQAMTKSTSIMGVSQAQIEELRKTALELSSSGTVIQTPKEMAEAYFFLASAGLSAQESMAALPRVSEFATAGAFDMALATDLLTDAQSALGLSTGDVTQKMANMQRVADVLVKANTLANATVQQFSESITNDAGAALKTYNKDVEEGVAVLAAYADQGIKGQVAGSQLGRVIRLLSSSALANAEAHEALGFSVFDANGKMNSFANILAQLERITGGMSDETRSATLELLGFQARVQNAILPLLGMSEQIVRYEEQLRKAGGTTAEVANNQMQSFTNQLQIAKNRSTVLAIAIGEALAPAVLEFNKLLSQLIAWFQGLNPRYQRMVALTLVAAMALGPLLIGLGLLISAVGKIITLVSIVAGVFTGWIGVIILAIAAIVGLVAGARLILGSWQAVGHFFNGLGTLIADSLVFAVRVAQRIWIIFFNWFQERIKDVFTLDFLKAVIQGLKVAAGAIVEFGKFAIAKLRAIFTGSESGTFEDFMSQYSSYAQEGRTTDDIIGSLRGAVADEYSKFQATRAGKSLLTPEAQDRVSGGVSTIQTAMESGREGASKSLEEIAKNTMKMTEALQNGEQPIYLSPLNLGTE